MRNIKFRAWCDHDKMMYYDIQDGIIFEDGSVYHFGDFINKGDSDYHKWVIEQFTGLKDINGKGIYEGDILESSGVCSVMDKIIFERGCFSFGGGFEDYLMMWNEDSEIIGNIHENPELLVE